MKEINKIRFGTDTYHCLGDLKITFDKVFSSLTSSTLNFDYLRIVMNFLNSQLFASNRNSQLFAINRNFDESQSKFLLLKTIRE